MSNKTKKQLINELEEMRQRIAELETSETERKQAEQMLFHERDLIQTLFENCPDFIYFKDREARFHRISKRFCDFFGLSEEDIIGKTDLELFPEEVAKQTYSEDLHVIKTGIPLINKEESAGEVWVLTTKIPWFDKEGNIIGLFGISRDITERKKAEEDIKQAAEEWRTTFDSINDLVFINDKNFRLLRVNKAFADALNMKPQELVGKTCYQLVHGTNEPVPNCPHIKTSETKVPATTDFFEPHLGIHLELTTSPIFSEKGEVEAVVHVARDISERKKMEQQLIVTDRLASIGELASGVAHELNNPLTSVIGFSELLFERDVPDDIKKDLKVVNTEAQRTARVVKNLLTFARKHEQLVQPVNINKAIQTVLELRAYEQKVNNIKVKTRLASDLPEGMADGFQLQQVFINIIINAEYFMGEAHGKGTLTITSERVDNIVRVSFADNGPGIAEEKIGHLFDPFFTTKEVGKGTGLGLSICHGIITEHGGRIYAGSELGKGATFIVELPVNK